LLLLSDGELVHGIAVFTGNGERICMSTRAEIVVVVATVVVVVVVATVVVV